jgi:hypothetical protein
LTAAATIEASPGVVVEEKKAAGGVLTAKQATHRPGTAPALGLRAGRVAAAIVRQTVLKKEIPMWFHSLFDALFARSSRISVRQRRHAPRDRQRSRSFRPRLEILEDRTLLSTYIVNSLTDTGAGSGLTGDFRYCIMNATSGQDAIGFAAGLTGAIKLESALPALNTSVTIQGSGAGQLTVERDPTSALSFGIFAVGSVANVQISGLTIANGNAGAIVNTGTLSVSNSILSGNTSSGGGGTLYNSGALTVSNSTLSGNTINTSFGSGGAIYNETGALTVSNSTLSGNTVYGSADYSATGGGIVMAAGTLSLSSSTLFNNTVVGGSYYYVDPNSPYVAPNGGYWIGEGAYGGGLYVTGGMAAINHSTFADNGAIGGYSDPGFEPGNSAGGGIYNAVGRSALQIYDTILADDLYGSFTSLGHNLIGNSSGGIGFAATDLLNVNPQLGPLQNNGGPTQTMALLAGSPAIDAGDNTSAPAYDQRGPGFARIVNGAIDIGAFEFQTSTPAQASSFSVSGFPSSTTAGAAGSFTVTAKNTDGTTATSYTGTVHFTSSDPQAGLPADYTFTATDNGVHAFSAALKTAGAQALTATDTTAGLTGSETSITVNPAAASRLGVSASAGGTAGTAFSVTVTALDPYNNAATGYTGAVHFTSTDGQAVLPSNYTFTAADNGVHTFSGVILKTAGAQTVAASDTVASAITGGAAVTINAAAASTMTVAGFPSSITAGAAGSLTVTLKDAYGNIATGYTGTVHFTSSDGKAALPANYTFTAADAGVHTFSAVLKIAGTQSLTVADTTTANLTGTDGGVTVNAAAASQFIISAPSTVTSGVAFSLTITVEDAYGNAVTGYIGTIHFTSSDGTATLPANYTFTAADKGVHTFTGLVLRKTGTQTLTITDTLDSALTDSVVEDVLAAPKKHK